jgi:hypothetical protein
MSAAKHTPGPWRRDSGGGLKGDVRGASGRWVALCWGIGNGDANRPEYKAECDANAHLIAAAPELLAVAQAARKCIVASMLSTRDRAELEPALDAAIAKATGSAA